jgi:sigma-E factor negative regulatory protein RseB
MPRFLLCAVALLLSPATAVADATTDWLLRINDAARTASYEGVIVYRDGQRMEVLRLAHRQHDGQVQERLTSLTGKARDILRAGDQVYFLTGGDERGQSPGAQGFFPMLSADRLAEAAGHYEYRALGEARVAGRLCRGVMLMPRDDYRYGYEICGDSETAVPLRITLLDRAGRTIEQLMFTEVAFPAEIADAAFAPPSGATPQVVPMDGPAMTVAATVSAAPVMPAPRPELWRVAALPPGFRIVRRELAPSPDGQGVVEHVLLSDGLSAVSVFGARAVAPERAFHGLSHMGAMSAYGRRVGAFHITVVGEVPIGTVRLIGDGLAPVEAGAP